MGCATSKYEATISPAVESSGIAKDYWKPFQPISAASWQYRTDELNGKGCHDKEEDQLELKEFARINTDNAYLQNIRLDNLHKYIEGEQVAAGWPSWLSAVAGEAIQGWVPLKADSFEKLEKIGQGTYSSVFRARNLVTGEIVALKKVRFDNFDPESVRFMAREIKILRRLDHPNIVKLEGLIASRFSCNLYLVFEYMEHDLSGLSASADIKYSESQVKCYMRQLLSGLEHCHSRNVIHRDIKGANLLVNNEGVLKLADFGLANFCTPGQPLTSRVVTLWYRSPELLLGSTNYEATIDLWSVGCVFAEMFVGKPILQGRTEVEQLHKIFRLCGSPPDDYWNNSKLPRSTIFRPHLPYPSSLQETFRYLPESVIALLETLLSIEPLKRGTASSALSSEYFRTKPYACEPSSLPKYLPTKEIDTKSRNEPHRRILDGRGYGSGGIRMPMRDNIVPGQPVQISKIEYIKEESHTSVDEKKDFPEVDGETRLFVDLHPMPSIKRPDEGHHVMCNSKEVLTFSGPLHVPSSGIAYGGSHSHIRPNSKSHLSYARDQSNMEEVKNEFDHRGHENGYLHNTHTDVQGHEQTELTKQTILKNCSKHYSQDFSEALHKGVQDRVEFSGPLLSKSLNVDELLQKNERHIRQAVRRSWFQRGNCEYHYQNNANLSCKTAYNFIAEKQHVSSETDTDWNKVWSLKTTPKVRNFVWKLLWGRLPTTRYLSSFCKVDSSNCFVCGTEDDNVSHILFDCDFAISYWKKLEQELKIRFNYKMNWHKGSWLNEFAPSNTKINLWLKEILAASLWHLWKNRNNCCFNKKKSGLNSLFCRAISDIHWSKINDITSDGPRAMKVISLDSCNKTSGGLSSVHQGHIKKLSFSVMQLGRVSCLQQDLVFVSWMTATSEWQNVLVVQKLTHHWLRKSGQYGKLYRKQENLV
ncbi:hypothetical protein Cni_G25754 [Canna indica]|uniref:[RNA-polymerase]-subunit kinase n=1 Tax=Canna indica TaxID=4628 RepID=A0AAQ3QPQ2_9LILI|nr:hypothetical protein Cni_G25754 [Canna indica]